MLCGIRAYISLVLANQSLERVHTVFCKASSSFGRVFEFRGSEQTQVQSGKLPDVCQKADQASEQALNLSG
jgi:hypothetical protein